MHIRNTLYPANKQKFKYTPYEKSYRKLKKVFTNGFMNGNVLKLLGNKIYYNYTSNTLL